MFRNMILLTVMIMSFGGVASAANKVVNPTAGFDITVPNTAYGAAFEADLGGGGGAYYTMRFEAETFAGSGVWTEIGSNGTWVSADGTYNFTNGVSLAAIGTGKVLPGRVRLFKSSVQVGATVTGKFRQP